LEVLQESLSGRALSGDMDVKVWETMKKWNSRLLVESVIWKELYESFFENPFRPFGPSEVYIATWNALFGEGTFVEALTNTLGLWASNQGPRI
jgi:hypothetical protein